MSTIDAQFSGVRDAFEKASRSYGSGVRASAAASAASTETGPASHDAVHDTVTLSTGGEKIVNLNRGQELAQQLKNAPVDKDFAENLKKSTQDVFRITQLFTQSVKSAFNWLR